MIKPVIIFVLLILLAADLNAADKLLVYHVNKQVHWMHDGKKEPAKRGVFLLQKHSIMITSKADVMIVQDDGKSLLLEKPGTYSFEQIKLLLHRVKTESVSKNFFSYVFEKFVSGGDGNEKQKVAAVVYRGKKMMQSPPDSSFAFVTQQLQWKPDYATAPHRIEIIVNGISFDTLIRNKTSINIPDHLLKPNDPSAKYVQWRCYPSDSKQAPPLFAFIIPAKKDIDAIHAQLAHLNKTFGNRKQMLQYMKKDLFASWAAAYH